VRSCRALLRALLAPHAQDRAAAQETAIRDVSSVLGVTPGSASLLLRRYKWNQDDLVSRYWEDPESVCRDAGVPSPGAPSAEVASMPWSRTMAGSVCAICREVGDAPGGAVTVSALACGHAFCDSCWAVYLGMKVSEGDTAIACPQYQCPLRVPEEVVARLCPPEVASKFKAFLRNSYVDDSRNVTWCPAPGCALAVDTSDLDSQYVTCGGGHTFCTVCKLLEAHAPAPCDMVRLWQRKCSDDSETSQWLNAHTQDCPGCKSTIEKNGGWCACVPALRVCLLACVVCVLTTTPSLSPCCAATT
jgi:ariadne-1